MFALTNDIFLLVMSSILFVSFPFCIAGKSNSAECAVWFSIAYSLVLLEKNKNWLLLDHVFRNRSNRLRRKDISVLLHNTFKCISLPPSMVNHTWPERLCQSRLRVLRNVVIANHFTGCEVFFCSYYLIYYTTVLQICVTCMTSIVSYFSRRDQTDSRTNHL